MALLPKTLLLLDEPYLRAGYAYYAYSIWWRFARKLANHCEAFTLYVPLRETDDVAGTNRAEVQSLRVVGRPFYRRVHEYYAGLPRWHRRLARQAAELVQTHDLIVCRLPSPGSKYLVRAARQAAKPLALLLCGDIVTQSSAQGLRGHLVRLAAQHVRRKELLWASQSVFVGIWGEALRDAFQSRCANVAACQSPAIEQSHLTWREDTCMRRPIRIVRVCQLTPHKGIEFLIHAIAALRQERRDVVLDVVGPQSDEPYAVALENLRARLGLHDSVRFHGRKAFGAPLFEWYHQADVHVVSSLGEGVPRCIAEARAFCVPTVATSVGGIPSVVTDGQNGLMVPPKDPAALAGAIRRIMDDGELRRRIIREGFDIAARSTAEVQAERLARLIADAMAASAARGVPGR